MSIGSTVSKATVDDLRRIAGDAKAELVSGEVVLMSPTGGIPGRAGGRIYSSLDRYEQETDLGYAFPDNVGFLVDLPDRQSFSPDAAFFIGAEPDMQFPVGAPAFAAEVRSENDYGPQAERAIAAKRADYFAAGTQVVWDVDLLSDEVIRCYRADAPNAPAIFRRGEIANAEPALPGWRFPVGDLFPPRRNPADGNAS
jgi:Uma2 family endonuclease